MINLISVIVPIFNKEECLKKCLESILRQTYTSLELILVNDGSTDNSQMICEEYMKNDDRIKLVNIDNSGVSKARNIGLKHALGDFVTFVDCDDFIEKEMYEKMITCCQINNYDLLACHFDMILNGITYNHEEHHLNDVFEKKMYEYLIKNQVHGAVWRILFNKNILNNIFFNADIKISEDLLFTTQALTLSNKSGVMNDCFYHYVQSDKEGDKIKYFNKRYIRDRYLLCYELNKILGNSIHFNSFKYLNYLAIIKCMSFDNTIKSLTKFMTKAEIKYLNNNVTFTAYLKENKGIKAKIFAILARCKLYKLINIIHRKLNKIN